MSSAPVPLSANRVSVPSAFKQLFGRTFLCACRKQRRRLYENNFKNATWQRDTFVLAGRWALDGLDQPTMRWLSKTAKREHVAVADLIYEAIESFVARCEAEAELEMKIIKFPTSLKR
jgi:hypothetical protein